MVLDQYVLPCNKIPPLVIFVEYLYFIMLALKWFACTYKSYNSTDDEIKGFTSLRLRICFEKCGLKDKTSELWHKLEQVLQWKVRKAHHKKVKSEGEMGH